MWHAIFLFTFKLCREFFLKKIIGEFSNSIIPAFFSILVSACFLLSVILMKSFVIEWKKFMLIWTMGFLLGAHLYKILKIKK